MDQYLTLERVDPLTRYFFRDGAILDATSDLAHMAEQIERIEPRDVEGYLDFLAYAARIHRITGPVFIYNEPPTLKTFGRAAPLDLTRVDPWLTMDAAIRKRVRSPQMRMLLGRFATYVGASPFLAPATLSVIAHVELTGGVWYPQGGVYAIAEALARLATEMGVRIETDAAVADIVVRDGRASGVRLQDGSQRSASAVVCNVDVTTAYHTLLPSIPSVEKRMQQWVARETSCSGFVLLLGVEGVHAELAHHNLFFTEDYRREFDEIFEHGVPPSDPTVYVAITSKSDPRHAPSGCENWFVLVNAPPTNAGFDWEVNASAYREVVLATLARAGFDIRNAIRHETMLTPPDLERNSGAWRGALYGISSNRALNAFRRPHNRCPDVRGLYFAGGATHPGGGVPMVVLSGKVAANLLLKDAS
jgi:phytoene desaturase